MWAFRNRPEKLNDEQRRGLEELFARLPDLERVYWFRWGLTEVFDEATDEQDAAERLDEYRSLLDEAEQDDQAVLEFFASYDEHRDGILAYFAEGKTSGVVEGLNNKARVITKRCYGVKSTQTLWDRLCLDVNWVSKASGWTVQQMHQLTNRIRAKFLAIYT
jgi:transposase